MSDFIPDIARNNYRGESVAQFLAAAPAEHVARYRRDCIGRGPFIIWDPESDADGFMICGMSVAELNREFLKHLGEYIA